MFGERRQDQDTMTDEPRRAGEDTAAEATGTILRRLLANLRRMAQAYALEATQDVRLAVRDIVIAAALFGVLMMLGVYLIALLLAAAVLALALVLPAWAAALIVFGAAAVAGGLLLLAAVSKLRRVGARFRTTIRAAREDLRWLRTRVLRID